MRPWFNFSILALHILFACLYRMLLHLSFFLYIFLTYLLLYLSFPLRIDLLLFQAGVHFFWLANECLCCDRFSFFHTKPRDWLVETSPKWPILCRVGRKTTTESVNHFLLISGSVLLFPAWGLDSSLVYYCQFCKLQTNVPELSVLVLNFDKIVPAQFQFIFMPVSNAKPVTSVDLYGIYIWHSSVMFSVMVAYVLRITVIPASTHLIL